MVKRCGEEENGRTVVRGGALMATIVGRGVKVNVGGVCDRGMNDDVVGDGAERETGKRRRRAEQS